MNATRTAGKKMPDRANQMARNRCRMPKDLKKKGYRYKLTPVNKMFEPLYVKTIQNVAQTMRDNSDQKFIIEDCKGD